MEDKGNIREYIKEGFHGIDVVLAGDIKYYKKRKVRVLNGSHTNLVPVGLMKGFVTVYDCMKDDETRAFVNETLDKEIIPFVSDDVEETKKFAKSIIDRFMNPFLNHRLTSIALNSVSKWRARVLPSFKDYYEEKGEIPRNLATGFGYLMAMYKSVKKGKDGKYYADLPSGRTELNDNAEYLDYFANGGCVNDVCVRLEKLAGKYVTGSIDGIFALTHQFGCSQLGEDNENIKKLLCAVALNPNASYVLFVGLRKQRA